MRLLLIPCRLTTAAAPAQFRLKPSDARIPARTAYAQGWRARRTGGPGTAVEMQPPLFDAYLASGSGRFAFETDLTGLGAVPGRMV